MHSQPGEVVIFRSNSQVQRELRLSEPLALELELGPCETVGNLRKGNDTIPYATRICFRGVRAIAAKDQRPLYVMVRPP